MNVFKSAYWLCLKRNVACDAKTAESNRSLIGGGGIRVLDLETRDAAIRRTRLHNERLAEAQISSIRVRALKLTGPLGSLTSHIHERHILRLTSNSSVRS